MSMTVQDFREVKNPYSLSKTVALLRHYVMAVKRPEALALLDKAVAKAEGDEEYAQRFEAALLHGSTIECRSVFSDFGDYWAKTSDEIPYYPHHDAVNLLDTALFHIKLGDTDEAIEDFNFLHN